MKLLSYASAIFIAMTIHAAVAQSPRRSPPATARFLPPDKTEFVARGINIRPEDMVTVARTVTTLFPGINFIRLAIDNGACPTPADLELFVSQMAAQHIVVEIEDHPWPSPGTYKGVTTCMGFFLSTAFIT